MRNSLIVLALLSFFVFSACEKKEENKIQDANAPAGAKVVKVEERLDTPEYSYLEVSDKDGNKYWMAVRLIEAVKGDIIYYTKSMEMKNFHSKTLNRDFASILFVEDAMKTPHNMKNPTANSTPKVDPTVAHMEVLSTPKADVKVEHLKDGKTVEQVYTNMNQLAGKTVKIRGQVVKYNPEILDRNWIHIQDGTGSGATFDLMVTSKDAVQVGQIVVIEGKVSLNKDFGSGYIYKVMVEDAKVKVEKGI